MMRMQKSVKYRKQSEAACAALEGGTTVAFAVRAEGGGRDWISNRQIEAARSR